MLGTIRISTTRSASRASCSISSGRRNHGLSTRASYAPVFGPARGPDPSTRLASPLQDLSVGEGATQFPHPRRKAFASAIFRKSRTVQKKSGTALGGIARMLVDRDEERVAAMVVARVTERVARSEER